MKGFFLIMLITIIGANFYVFFRIWHLMPATTVGRIILPVFALAAVGSLFIGIMAGNSMPTPLASAVYKLGTSWMMIVIYLFMIFLVLDLGRLVRLLPMDFLSGSWLKLGIIAGATCVIMLLGYLHYVNKTRTEINITVSDNNDTPPLKIVALSDMHLGYGIGSKEFRKWIDLINDENPDLVIIAGDIIDNSLRPLRDEHIGGLFKEINSTYGIFAVPGNHEYISGIGESVKFLEEAGVKVLRDSIVNIAGRLYLAGRDDRSNRRRKPLGDMLAAIPDRELPVILLDHQPYRLEEAEKAGVLLQFSGHTHRGQVWPLSLLTDNMYEVSYGHKIKGDTHIYVSSGIGIWGGHFRIGTNSEYVVITLK